MASFKDKKWITSNFQLRNLLLQCKHCKWITMNGSFILPYDKIATLHVPKRKFSLILNTKKFDDSSSVLGHWISCSFDVKTKIATLHDSLNEIEQSHRVVLDYIKVFCNIHNFKLNILRLKTQASQNVNCGLHSIWFAHKSHKLNANALLKLRRLFQSYTVAQREQFVMNDVLLNFKF